MSRIPLPSPTFNNLVPVSAGYQFFQHFKDFPFQASDTAYSPVKAWWLSEASHLVYGEEPFIRKQLDDSGVMTTLGLSISFFQGAAAGAQCFVIENDGMAMVAFRGTRVESVPDPILNLKLRLLNMLDVVTDVDLRLDPETHVHAGFQRSLDEIWKDLYNHVEAIRGKTIWFTGHSLGAALATIAAARFENGTIDGLYTFGSPRVGDDVFKASFTVPYYRFVNNADIVPHVPLPSFLAKYAHVGDLRFIDSAGHITPDPSMYKIIDSNVRSHMESLKAGLSTFNFSNLKEAGQAIRDAISQRQFSTIGGKLEALNLDFVPVAVLADHSPIYYTIKIWNDFQPDQ
jgi:hypothetical protein